MVCRVLCDGVQCCVVFVQCYMVLYGMPSTIVVEYSYIACCDDINVVYCSSVAQCCVVLLRVLYRMF